jgi:hypothetical protein
MADQIERWDLFELALQGPASGNPFVEVEFSAEFKYKNRVVVPDGFYDGNGVYRVRFMPDTLGEWNYRTRSNVSELDGMTGSFTCTPPSPGNRGPVYVENTYHFAYADGTPYYQVGTTCYVWNHQGDALEEQTLETLKSAPFNKMRMCVFPKHYRYNHNEPPYYPFERIEGDGWNWDFTRFNPEHFRHLEQRVGDLRALGIEADIILFHPYDRWGFATMDAETDDRYLRYVVARLAAYRNVWWSMANEFDLMQEKTMADWDRFFRVVQESDPYQHLRSVHNCRVFYDHGKPWVTHQSIQHSDLASTNLWRDQYRKPVVVDECCYEGNIPNGWGNISAQEMVHRFWEGTVRGGYVGHGETYLHPDEILWWSKGGVLHGQSPERIAFLHRIMQDGPERGLNPVEDVVVQGRQYAMSSKGDDYYLIYFGIKQPAEATFNLPAANSYRGEVIDTWEMTLTPLGENLSGKFTVELPGKPCIAVRFQKQ